ncbi:hypothetical protein AAFF_G00385560 [Aldrovandia affinis]|uniref:Uncharacterized protein n=1 Tax=Aldrovandia affinis TaxID=143900 RepID=A0AAD7WLP7_9TELE|nr:hypothetical protein AAFF_G00385560 [Aldrovandia affinis]
MTPRAQRSSVRLPRASLLRGGCRARWVVVDLTGAPVRTKRRRERHGSQRLRSSPDKDAPRQLGGFDKRPLGVKRERKPYSISKRFAKGNGFTSGARAQNKMWPVF